jgi:cyclopentanol dehydrogenase
MGRMEGKVAIVTGAAKGMGRSHAVALAREGASVVVADVDATACEVTVDTILSEGGRAIYLPLDVTQEEAWKDVVAETVYKLGRPDVLVNNAGIIIYKTLIDTSLDEWNKVFAVNSTGTFLGCREIAAVMKDGRGGSIVNMSSALGVVGASGVAAYQASKGAVTIFSKAAASELAPYGVRVNSVHPGLVATPMTEHLMNDPAAIDALLGPTLIRRVARPEEITNAVLYLASDESSYVTGSSLMVDGGFSAV